MSCCTVYSGVVGAYHCFLIIGVFHFFNGVVITGVMPVGMSSLSSNFHFFFTAVVAVGVVKVFFDHSFLGNSNFSNSFFH